MALSRSGREEGGFVGAARCGALGARPMVGPEFEQRRLLCPGVRVPLLAAKLQQLAPEIALAVELDEFRVRHDGLFRLSDPHGGGERGHVMPPQPSAAVIGFWGDCPAPRRSLQAGEGSQNPSLTASGGGYSAFVPLLGAAGRRGITTKPRGRKRKGEGGNTGEGMDPARTGAYTGSHGLT